MQFVCFLITVFLSCLSIILACSLIEPIFQTSVMLQNIFLELDDNEKQNWVSLAFKTQDNYPSDSMETT